MENKELIVIESKNVITAFNDDGIDPYIKQAQDLVKNFNYDLSTGVSRAKIASLSSKVSKFKTKLDGVGKDLVAEWKSKSTAVDKSRKKMRDELDALRDLARKPLTDWENEQKEIAAKKLADLEAEKVTAEFERCYEVGHLMDEKFDRDVLEAKKEAEAEAKRVAAQEARELVIHEQKLKDDAAAAAKLKAENDAEEAIRLADKAKQDAIDQANQSKIDAAAAKQRAIDLDARLKQDAINAKEKAKQDEINANNLAVENDAYNDDYAFNAERKRLYDVEQERLAGIQRQQDEQARINAETAKREADTQYKREVHQGIIAAFVLAGINEEDSIKAMKVLVQNLVPKVKVNY